MGNTSSMMGLLLRYKVPILVDEPKVNPVDEPKVNPVVNPKANPVVNPKANPVVNPKANPKVILLVDNYWVEEVKEMTVDHIVREFVRITGCEELYCKHCKRETKIMEKWVEAITTRCKKVGIYKEMEVPKTCDKQLLANKKRNPICNPINNPVYPRLDKRMKVVLEREEKNALIQKRMDDLKKVNVMACPYKYVIEHL
jgi:hypothetical protein